MDSKWHTNTFDDALKMSREDVQMKFRGTPGESKLLLLMCLLSIPGVFLFLWLLS